jgi:hypothetical protein
MMCAVADHVSGDNPGGNACELVAELNAEESARPPRRSRRRSTV